MDRRRFFYIGAAAGAASAVGPASPENGAPAAINPGYVKGRKTWLFWDLWKLDGITGVDLKQGRPQWLPEATYADPVITNFSTWPLVHRDARDGVWRMLYTANWIPYTLLVASSQDGLRWKPEPHMEIQPPQGNKIAPHHLLSLPNGSGGGPYLDPQARDGNRFRIFAIQHGPPAHRRAAADARHPLHQLSRSSPPDKRYFVDHLTLVSRDGLRWNADYTAVWNRPGWHPEPPVYAFFNHRLGRHAMTSRTGHGERRLVIQSSPDARAWSGPELLLQPDPLDKPLVQFYGMPVVPYENYFVGLVWHFHVGDSHRLDRYNHFIGPLDCYLAYSYDGVRFSRGLRQPFIGLNEPGEPGCGVIQTSCMADLGDELRFYSSACQQFHGLGGKGIHILAHRLRRDGFMYLESTGNWGAVLSKPMVLFDPEVEVNVSAPSGEMRFQWTGVDSQPLPGFSFDDCVAVSGNDEVRWRLRWKSGASVPLRKPLRLEVEFRHARLFAVRGDFHFIDAHDQHLLHDGHSIDPSWFDH